jgi:hypothetical protein
MFMSDLGFKELTSENWLIPDTTMRGFVRLSFDGKENSISGEEWLHDILQPKIHETVPIEVRKLFEVARVLAYGIFFYPIYTLGIEQLHRVVESAVGFKCKTMSAPSKINTFKKKIEWLIEKGAISKSKSIHWEGVRGLRNIASHPEMQSIYMPIDALKFIESAAVDINSLFSND